MASTLFDELLEEYKRLYKQFKNIEYVPDSGDKKAIGLIIGKIRKLKPAFNTVEMKQAVTWFFNASFTEAPEWIRKANSLKLINSKFNEIRDHQKNRHDPVKEYAAKNLKQNYYNGNKKIQQRSGNETSLNELINGFTK